MPGVIVFSRRGIHVRPGSDNDFVGLYVPSQDQVIKLRDVDSDTDHIADRVRADGRIPLWREKRGQIVVYGLLSNELREIRQSLRVWLAEDFAPTGCSAFFFIFGGWVVHGLKETDDERQETWRSTVLSYTPQTLQQNLKDAVADLLLRVPARDICVAVNGSNATLQDIAKDLQEIDVATVPFASLKPKNSLAPLYRHRDFTIGMVLSTLLFSVLFLGAMGYLVLNLVESARLQSRIGDVRRQIDSIQISRSLGHIREPQPLLQAMKKPFEQQPSAILDAGVRFARALGELRSAEFNLTGEQGGQIENGEIPMTVTFGKIYDKLLVQQESTTRQLLPQASWVRSVARLPGTSDPQVLVKLQVESPQGVTLPSATSVFQPALPPPPVVSGTEGTTP